METQLVQVVHATLDQCPEAMEFIDIREIPIQEINHKFGGNPVRVTGLQVEGIKAFIQVMERGKYAPQHFEPPVVEELPEGHPDRINPDTKLEQYTYRLVTGHHRHAAHMELKKSTFYAQVVKFHPARNQSEDYWRTMWQITENVNHGNFVASYATLDDIARAASKMVEEKEKALSVKESSETMINNALTDIMGTTPKGKKTELLSKVYEARGDLTKVVHTYSQHKKRRFRELHSEWRRLNINNVVAQNFVPDGVSADDYDYRGIAKVWEILDENPKALGKIEIVGSTTKADYKEVKLVRRRKEQLYQKHADTVLRRAAFLLGVDDATLMSIKRGSNYERFCKIPIFWIPSLYGEEEKVYEREQLIRLHEDQ